MQKLAWDRSGGEVSDRQWKDLVGVLKVSRGNLDMAYLQRWSKHLGVDELLNRAVRETESDRVDQ